MTMTSSSSSSPFNYTAEHLAFLKERVALFPWKRVAEMFNHHFGTNFNSKRLSQYARKRGICRPTETWYFSKGLTPWNKGLKGYDAGGNSALTRFKKGERPSTWKPIGSERKCTKDGYILVKVAEKTEREYNWRPRAQLVLEQAGYVIAKGDRVVHRNGIPDDDRLENLLLVSKEIYARISHCTLVYGVPFQQLSPDLQDAILLNAQLKQKIKISQSQHQSQDQGA